MNKPETYYSNARRGIAPLLPQSFSSVLDLGCGAGATLNWIGELYRPSRMVGVEIEPAEADRARSNGFEVHAGPLEVVLPTYRDRLGRFDVILALDVLEHLVDPWKALKVVAEFLNPGGVLVASTPNVRVARVVWNLAVRGEWRYEASGVLDRTHLRFFTRRGIEQMLSETFLVERVMPSLSSRGALLNRLSLGSMEEFLAVQYLVRARSLISA